MNTTQTAEGACDPSPESSQVSYSTPNVPQRDGPGLKYVSGSVSKFFEGSIREIEYPLEDIDQMDPDEVPDTSPTSPSDKHATVFLRSMKLMESQ